MTRPDDDPLSEDMAERIRKANLPRTADGGYVTNQGTVYLEGPHEAARRRVYDNSRSGRRTALFKGVRDEHTMAMARTLARDPELDIDWGDYAPPKEETDAVTTKPVLPAAGDAGGTEAGGTEVGQAAGDPAGGAAGTDPGVGD